MTVACMFAALIVGVLLAPAAAAAPADDLERERAAAERRSGQLDDEIDAARTDMARTRARRTDALDALARIDRQQTALAAELDALTTELRAAEGLLAEADQAVRRTEIEIDRTDDELAEAARELETRRGLLKARARATYMHRGVSYAEAVLDVETAGELGVSMQYLRSLLQQDNDQVERIATLERQREASLDRLDALRAAQDQARAQRRSERDRVAALVAERREVEAQLDARAAEHEALVAQLSSDVDEYAAAIDEMEQRSSALEQRLADIAEQERDRAQQRAARQRADAGDAAPGGDGSPGQAGPSNGGGSSGADGSSGGDGSGDAASAGDRPPAGGAATGTATGRMQSPVRGTITSPFGYRTHPVLGTQRLHAGVDFGAPAGTPIVAADGGRVVVAGWYGGYGNAVVIDHGGGIATLYGHQSRLAVAEGAAVSRGQTIGAVGSTGMSTGPHLHFEVRRDGTPVDPMGHL